MISGQYKQLRGLIIKKFDSSLGKVGSLLNTLVLVVLVKTSEKVPLELKVWVKDLKKYFELGESVRVMSGVHAGNTGIVTAISDKHAFVSMEGTKSELKILLSNLKIKKEDMENVKLQDVINKTQAQMRYMAGDLITYDSHQTLGLILQVLPDFLKVLNTMNKVVNVKISGVSKKIIPRRNVFILDSMNNAVANKTMVKIINSSSIFNVSGILCSNILCNRARTPRLGPSIRTSSLFGSRVSKTFSERAMAIRQLEPRTSLWQVIFLSRMSNPQSIRVSSLANLTGR